MIEDYEDLKTHVVKLKTLLDDPQPGLMSWNIMVGKELNTITDWWTKEDNDE